MCIHNTYGAHTTRQQGLSLVELLMFIVIVSVAITGVLSVSNVVTRHSADPMIRKQAIAIAESLLEEIELQSFTLCDPDDPNATISGSTCTTPQGFTPTVSGGVPEKRDGSSGSQFDNVGDYGGFSMNPITDIAGNPIAGLNAYSATVTINHPSNPIGGVSADAIAEIAVRVTGPSNTDVTLTGYRFRYAPQAIP